MQRNPYARLTRRRGHASRIDREVCLWKDYCGAVVRQQRSADDVLFRLNQEVAL
jgi:hypothetical protein